MGKQIIALSKAQYRGVTIYEVPGGVSFFLGEQVTKDSLKDATDYIDDHFKRGSEIEWTVEMILDREG